MRNITKIFLLIVAAFVAYLVWPRTANLKGFNPNELAKLRVEQWTAERDNQSQKAWIARYRIYTSQFNFSPLMAYRMAASDGAALAELRRLKAEGAESPDDSKAVEALAEKYAILKRQTNLDLVPDAVAREDAGSMVLLLDGAPASDLAGPMARVLATRYGGTPEDFAQVSADLAQARVLIFQGTPGGAAEGESAEDHTRAGYTLLKEIAATAVATPAQP